MSAKWGDVRDVLERRNQLRRRRDELLQRLRELEGRREVILDQLHQICWELRRVNSELRSLDYDWDGIQRLTEQWPWNVPQV